MSIGCYTLRLFLGRHPLCGIGVTSFTAVTSRPADLSERIAASRPAPGPLIQHSTFFIPSSRHFPRGPVGGLLRGERRALARALETHGPRTRPRHDVPRLVGDGHDGVVERRLDVGDARDVYLLAFFFFATRFGLSQDVLLDRYGLARSLAAGFGGAAAGRCRSSARAAVVFFLPAPGSTSVPCACARWSACAARARGALSCGAVPGSS